MLSVKKCAALVKKEYPSFHVYGFFEYQGEYYFTIVPKGRSARKSLLDLHRVDRNSGSVTGAIPALIFLEQPGAVEAIKNMALMGRYAMIRRIYCGFLKRRAMKGKVSDEWSS